MPERRLMKVGDWERTMNQTGDLIRAYDDAARRVIEMWERHTWKEGELAEALRQLKSVYRRERGGTNVIQG